MFPQDLKENEETFFTNRYFLNYIINMTESRKGKRGTCRSKFEVRTQKNVDAVEDDDDLPGSIEREQPRCICFALGEDNVASILIIELDPRKQRETKSTPKSTARTPIATAPCRSMISPTPLHSCSLDPARRPTSCTRS